MKKTIPHLIAIFFVAVIAAGCASSPSRFYTLNATATADGSPALQCAIAIGPVTVPALVDHPPITVQLATNRVAVDEFNRWAEPLNENIAALSPEIYPCCSARRKWPPGRWATSNPD